MIFSTKFWQVVIDRAVRTAAEVALITIGADKAFDAFHADWGLIVGMSLGGAILTVLLAIVKPPKETKL